MTPVQQVTIAVARLPKVRYVSKWDSSTIAGKGTWKPKFVMLHHTALPTAITKKSSSLAYVTRSNGTWGPVRLCHFLIDRDGTVHVCAAVKTYHAGTGGPRWGVAAGAMNAYAWGIEIEDPGLGQTMTAAQIESAAILTAGLIDAMGVTDANVIQHKEWNPSGKTDTRYTTAFWRERVAAARAKPKEPKPVAASKSGPTLKHNGKVGATTQHKVPVDTPVTVVGAQWYTAAVIDIPKGGEYALTFQVRMPKGVGNGEVELVRLGWPGLAKQDSTGHNVALAAVVASNGELRRWRTPIQGHLIVGGGPVAFRILMPKGNHKQRFVCKATRVT